MLVKTHTSRKDHEINLVAVYGSPDGSTASSIPIPLGEQKNRKPWKEAAKKTIKLADAAATEKTYHAEPDRRVRAADCDAQVTGESAMRWSLLGS